jgi:hypothetical protein
MNERLVSIRHNSTFKHKMKCKKVMTNIFFDKMPNWLKYHEEKDIRIVRKVIIHIYG